MNRPDVDRMRRNVERSRAHQAQREHEQWLASLTPEHRAIHARTVFCGECMADASRQAMESIARIGVLARGVRP